MEIILGIDQSLNSTGLTIELYADSSLSELIDKHFYIITGKDKLTNKENKAQQTYKNFDYIIYKKHEIKTASNAHEKELFKTFNIITISKCILKLLTDIIYKYNTKYNIYVCMEGISYQSANTSSIIELAGLNYVIRYELYNLYITNKNIINIFKLIVSAPTEIKKFASGNGSAKKDTMITLFEAIHPNLYLIPKIDDIADSYWMAQYIKHLILNNQIS